MSAEKRKRVFISYGHKDGFDFVRRLAFSLEMYMEVFWDKRLRYGKFDEQLFSEIEKCDFLIIVMTPYALREDGWCHLELEHAVKNNKPIVPIKLHDDCGFQEIEEKLEQYQYADFRRGKDFNIGFQQLTQILLGQPYYSWEYFIYLNDADLLTQLDAGRLPKIIAEEITEWIVLKKAWSMVKQDVESRKLSIYITIPTTLAGVARCCKILIAQAAQINDAILAKQARDIEKIVKNYHENLQNSNLDDNFAANIAASKLIEDVYKLNLLNASGNMNAKRFGEIEGFFEFEVSEQLRELINTHARRSRYLY